MTTQTPTSIYDFSVKTIDGTLVKLEVYQGKVLLIVNTASQCGFTPQYKGLQALYEQYAEKDFMVLGFPCNQFGQQEPGNSEEIQSFCETGFGVSFPLFQKIDVNGSNAHPLYQYLTQEAPGILGTKNVKWNFTKFLVDRKGKVVKRYPPTVTPKAITQDILKVFKTQPDYQLYEYECEYEKAYDAAKEYLRKNPEDYQAREAMVKAGREYYARSREGRQPTIYDEQAINNDLIAIIGK